MHFASVGSVSHVSNILNTRISRIYDALAPGTSLAANDPPDNRMGFQFTDELEGGPNHHHDVVMDVPIRRLTSFPFDSTCLSVLILYFFINPF